MVGARKAMWYAAACLGVAGVAVSIGVLAIDSPEAPEIVELRDSLSSFDTMVFAFSVGLPLPRSENNTTLTGVLWVAGDGRATLDLFEPPPSGQRWYWDGVHLHATTPYLEDRDVAGVFAVLVPLLLSGFEGIAVVQTAPPPGSVIPNQAPSSWFEARFGSLLAQMYFPPGAPFPTQVGVYFPGEWGYGATVYELAYDVPVPVGTFEPVRGEWACAPAVWGFAVDVTCVLPHEVRPPWRPERGYGYRDWIVPDSRPASDYAAHGPCRAAPPPRRSDEKNPHC